MRRRKPVDEPPPAARPEAGPAPTAAAPVIHPHQIFDLRSAAQALGLKRSCLPRECRLGRLRYAKRAGKVLVLGRWLLEWLEGGEVRRQRFERPAANGNGTTGQ